MLHALLTLALGAAAVAPSANGWQDVLDRVAASVVVMRVNAPRAFDGNSTGYMTATGFVVDAERGILLTNRHVVMPGPVVSEAVFLNNEEVDVHAIYRDPVHDFGFYRFDPADVKFMDVKPLHLAPEKAHVGVEIRVVGNDAGEKLSFLAGTLARLDRDAPAYGRSGYNDFNTFYYQAASSTSGGSSGSPVVDLDGDVIAINAGGSRSAASSFYLPLNRVVRALDLIRAGDPVSRGTLQTTLKHLPYDELRRLGLRPETEAESRRRFPDGTGMIVVSQNVREGPADGHLAPGDIIVRLNGKFVTAFIPIEVVLDNHVGKTVMVEVERGGEPITVELTVGDLHAITPSRYLEFGGGILNELSYQQARNYSVPISGVFVSAPGYSLGNARIASGSIITQVDGVDVPTLEAFEKEMSSKADGARVPIRHYSLRSPRSTAISVVRVDRRWFTMQRCTRDDSIGRWPCELSPAPPPPELLKPASTRFTEEGDRALRSLAPSIATVTYDIPYRLDGVHGDSFQGAGLVVDAKRGLVVVDRETVPIAMGDVTLTFGGSVQVPGEVVYLHPEHNLAVIRYDPRLVGNTPIRAATLRPRSLSAGDDVWLVGLSLRQRLISRKTKISGLEPISLSLTYPPRFRDRNLDGYAITDSTSTIGGVLSDAKGRVHALWASYSSGHGKNMVSFFVGIPIERVIEIIEPLQAGIDINWRSLGVELSPLNIAAARDRGLSDARAAQLEKANPTAARVLSVVRLSFGSPAADLLEEGDLLLEIEGDPVSDFAHVERACQAERVNLRILRDGDELELTVPTQLMHGAGTQRALLWAGTLLQRPPPAVATQRKLPRSGVYVARFWFGSPANRYGLRATRRITAVDGIPTPDLDAFLDVVAHKPDRGAVRIELVDLDGRIAVITLKLDLDFWPTYELVRDDKGWSRRRVDPG
ncbi:MAG: trypsin-like peptidase domain-containing protein [Myxococcales bacterium]|nr:trypsin-like peptidase domain-containing protein [Myxococcales bacterium]